ncbi:MAG: DNA-3-methyladenine glycosylase family protein [Alphaproteobacteria bacterium]
MPRSGDEPAPAKSPPSPWPSSSRSAGARHAEAEAHLCRVDPRLGAVIERVGPCRLRPTIGPRSRPDAPWAALARAIVFQQLSGRAAGTIFGRVVALWGGDEMPAAEAVLSMPEPRLRGAGLSAAKTAAIRDLAAKTTAGLVPGAREILRLPDDEILARLTQVRGVGPWTVQMLLMFHLGRPDVLPSADLGVLQGFARVRRLREKPAPRELERWAERWRPWRTAASWYLWRALEIE